MAIRKLETNLPLTISAKDCAIVAGKFGAQVRLRGKVEGEDAMIFLPGKVWANLKSLRAAGVVPMEEYNEEPTEGETVEVPLLVQEFELVSRKTAADKYANLVVNVMSAAGIPSKSSIGKPIAGLDYDDDDLREKMRETGAPPNKQAQNVQARVLGTSAEPPIYAIMREAADFVNREIAPSLGLSGKDLGTATALAALTNTIVINRTR
jgi:hypothetical protein